MWHCDDGGPAGVADEGARGGAAGFLIGLGDWRFLRRIDPRLGQELVRLQPVVFDLERLSGLDRRLGLGVCAAGWAAELFVVHDLHRG